MPHIILIWYTWFWLEHNKRLFEFEILKFWNILIIKEIFKMQD